MPHFFCFKITVHQKSADWLVGTSQDAQPATSWGSGYLRRKGLLSSGGVEGKHVLRALQRNFGGAKVLRFHRFCCDFWNGKRAALMILV